MVSGEIMILLALRTLMMARVEIMIPLVLKALMMIRVEIMILLAFVSISKKKSTFSSSTSDFYRLSQQNFMSVNSCLFDRFGN